MIWALLSPIAADVQFSYNFSVLNCIFKMQIKICCWYNYVQCIYHTTVDSLILIFCLHLCIAFLCDSYWRRQVFNSFGVCMCVCGFFFLDCSQGSGSNLLLSCQFLSFFTCQHQEVSQDGYFSGKWLLFNYLSLCVSWQPLSMCTCCRASIQVTSVIPVYRY